MHADAFARSMVWRPLALAVLGFLLNACGPAGCGAAADADPHADTARRLLGPRHRREYLHLSLPGRSKRRAMHAVAFPCCHQWQPIWRAR
jgi:hypothetical protein